jgi:hypothetical protein
MQAWHDNSTREERFHRLYNLDAIMPQLEVRGCRVIENYFCPKARTAPAWGAAPAVTFTGS